jgi:uncharacterized peroxidase-related enzyme
MPRIDYVDPEDASEEVREYLADYSAEHGERSLMREMLANHPPLLEVTAVFFENSIRTGTLDRELKETVAVAVSQANGCDYCASSHRESMEEVLGLPSERVDAIRAEEFDSLPPHEQFAVEFARQAAENPHRITDEEFHTLREEGFDDQEIIELLGVVGLFMFVNTIGIATDIRPEDRDEKLPTY